MSILEGRRHFVVCVTNDGYAASLEVRKIYSAVPDSDAEKLGMMRGIDESGEDYLYPAWMFYKVELPMAVRQAVFRAAWR